MSNPCRVSPISVNWRRAKTSAAMVRNHRDSKKHNAQTLERLDDPLVGTSVPETANDRCQAKGDDQWRHVEQAALFSRRYWYCTDRYCANGGSKRETNQAPIEVGALLRSISGDTVT
jgi:hypothetical protein